MISLAAAGALNHLLDQQAWARERLAAHPGARIEFRTPPLPGAKVIVEDTGRVRADDAGEPDLVVTLSPFAMPLLAARSPDAMAHVQFAGPDALAAAVRGLMLALRWDVEEDLSKVVGDVAAHRIAKAGREAFEWQREAGERLARNFSEYWTEEQPLLARRADLEALARDVQGLREALDRVEARLSKPPA